MKNDVQFKVRLPEEVKQWLEKRAEENIRSQSAEIVAVLRTVMRIDQTEKADAGF